MSKRRQRSQSGKHDHVFGRHAAQALLEMRPEDVRRVVLLKGKRDDILDEYLEMTSAVSVEPEIHRWNDFLDATGLTAADKHQGICLFVKPREMPNEDDLHELKKARLVVALDQLSDPRNLATVLRSAAFFHVDAVLLMRYRSSEITPQVAKISAGGAELVRIFQVTNLANALKKLQRFGFVVYGLDERGERTLAETKFAENSVLVVGAEGQGMRVKTRNVCDELVRIPGGRKGIESLNAGVAASIAISEFSRS